MTQDQLDIAYPNIKDLAIKFKQQMPSRIKQYLNKRGINDELIKKFELGYAKNIKNYNWISIPVKDQKGNFLFIKLRREPGDDKNEIKYIPFPGGSALFNSEAINKATEIFICEGELDCITLDGQGVPAVCSTAGVATFKDEWIKQLSELNSVAVCFDRDRAGDEAKYKLAEKLSYTLPKSKILTLELPEEVGDKGDINDYFSKLGKLDPKKFNIDNFLASLKEFEPIPKYFKDLVGKIELISARDLSRMKLDEKDKWLIENFLVKGGVMILSSDPGNYKTWLMLYFASCVANGEDIFKTFKTKKGAVLIVDEENNKFLLRERVEQMKITSQDILFSILNNIKVDNEKTVKQLMEICRTNNIKLIIFDSLTRIHSREEDSSSQMREIFEKIKPLLKMGVSIIFTHHHRKSTAKTMYNLRGSSEISAFVNSHFAIERKGNKTNKITLLNFKMRDAEPLKDFAVQMKPEEGGRMVFVITESDANNLLKIKDDLDNVYRIISRAKEPLGIEELQKKLKGHMGESKIRSIVKELLKQKAIGNKPSKSNKHLFYKIEQ